MFSLFPDKLGLVSSQSYVSFIRSIFIPQTALICFKYHIQFHSKNVNIYDEFRVENSEAALRINCERCMPALANFKIYQRPF